MTKKVLVLLFIILVLILVLNSTGAAAKITLPDLLAVDFGAVTASEPVQQLQSLSILSEIAQPDGVSIETWGLVNYQNKERIPPERITLSFNNKTVPLTATPLIVDLNGVTNQQFSIQFALDLEPVDQPGRYQGVIQFRFREMQQNQPQWSGPIPVTLTVQVEPWIRLQTDATSLKLGPDIDLNNKNLANTEPLAVQLASNSNWQLSLNITFITKPAPNQAIPLLITTGDGSKQFQGTGPIQLTASDGPKVIASGSATVSNQSYWCDIPLNVKLVDYPNYSTSLYYFNVNFFGKVVQP